MSMHVQPSQAKKKAVNVSLDASLVEQARGHGINLSQLFERHLREAVRSADERAWFEANRESIEAYNARVENGTILSDFERQF